MRKLPYWLRALTLSVSLQPFYWRLEAGVTADSVWLIIGPLDLSAMWGYFPEED